MKIYTSALLQWSLADTVLILDTDFEVESNGLFSYFFNDFLWSVLESSKVVFDLEVQVLQPPEIL